MFSKLALLFAVMACSGTQETTRSTSSISFGLPESQWGAAASPTDGAAAFRLKASKAIDGTHILPPSGDVARVLPVKGEPHLGAIVTAWGGVECTASLIAADTIVSAAHCFECADGNSWSPFLGYWFMTYEGDTPSRTLIPIRAVASIVSCTQDGRPSVLARDVAVARLATAVGVPAPSFGTARRDQTVRVYGAGCLSLENTKYSKGNRRYVEGLWREFFDVNVLCFGDSGGPVVDYPQRKIVGINVGFNRKDGTGIFVVLTDALISDLARAAQRLDAYVGNP